MAQRKNKQKNSVRIISGVWRSRRIHFLNQAHIRPTPDRVRETLFNWINNYIVGARCLDLFSGSGALGFEAASRGAEQVVLVESDLATSKILQEQKKLLDAAQIGVIQQDALSYLHEASPVFDLVFIDPPYASDLYHQVLSTLLSRKLITIESLLYIESSSQSKAAQIDLAKTYQLACVREKSAGEVYFGLYHATAI